MLNIVVYDLLLTSLLNSNLVNYPVPPEPITLYYSRRLLTPLARIVWLFIC